VASITIRIGRREFHLGQISAGLNRAAAIFRPSAAIMAAGRGFSVMARYRKIVKRVRLRRSLTGS